MATILWPIPSRSIVTFGSSFFSFIGFLRLVAVFAFFVAGGLFLVALRFDRRRIAFLQDDGIDTPRDRMLIARKVKPGDGESEVRAGRKIERLAALVEDRVARVAGPIRDHGVFGCFQGINEDGARVVLEEF